MDILNYRQIAAAVLVVLSAGVVSSCSDDDEPGKNDTGSVKVNPAQVFTQGVPKQVGDLKITTDAAGLVTRIVDGDKVSTFSYEAVSRARNYDMTMNVEWGDDEDGVDFWFILNDQGFVEYAYEEDESEYDGLQTNEWWFKYNDKGQLIEMKRTEGNNEVTTITYNADGDIVKVHMESDYDPEHPYDRDEMTAEITYSSTLNKGGIMLYDETFMIDMDEMAPAYYAGLLGIATKHLPSRTIEDDDDEYTFTWTMNSNDLPTHFRSETKNNPYDNEDKDFVW